MWLYGGYLGDYTGIMDKKMEAAIEGLGSTLLKGGCIRDCIGDFYWVY